MAHIADYMLDAASTVGMNNYIARELSPHSSQERKDNQGTGKDNQGKETPTEEKEKFVWRMHQPHEPRKYGLFPSKENLSIKPGRKSPSPEPDMSLSSTTGSMGNGERDRPTVGANVRTKPKEQSLIRRRKVSVPELGPMTTVQEIAMDSPTIPGRPPMHERSISAPGNNWRQHIFGESMLSLISGPAFDESAEIAAEQQQGQAKKDGKNASRSASPKRPLSPKILAPLVIPTSSAPQPKLAHKGSHNRIRASTEPPAVPPKSARMLENAPKGTPYTPYTPAPYSASAVSLASTAATSVSNTPFITNTPLSALPTSAPDGRSSPKPWSAGAAPPVNHSRGLSEVTHKQEYQPGHRRHESEASIMDRGRPKKRLENSPMKRKPSIKASPADEQKAFETLPQGVRAKDAMKTMTSHEMEIIRKQAYGQASRFEVLSSRDVDDLSRELRGLDERCEYLRKTHRSLRSGRRNLHDRICTYLRSPRVARFSHESILKQEEALSELDASIDDWVSKLEQAENRRTRVRQKLLEHVAGALIMQPMNRDEDMSTPPRSPTKTSPSNQSPHREGAVSPQRLAAPVEVSSPEPSNRRDVESIRIYADSDISALLADVEEEIKRMAIENPPVQEKEENESETNMAKSPVEGLTLNAVAFQGLHGY